MIGRAHISSNRFQLHYYRLQYGTIILMHSGLPSPSSPFPISLSPPLPSPFPSLLYPISFLLLGRGSEELHKVCRLQITNSRSGQIALLHSWFQASYRFCLLQPTFIRTCGCIKARLRFEDLRLTLITGKTHFMTLFNPQTRLKLHSKTQTIQKIKKALS